MSIKRYCDACDTEITRNYVTERVEGDAVLSSYKPIRKRTDVHVSVIAGVGKGVSNSGDLCGPCVLDAVEQVVGVVRPVAVADLAVET